MIREAKGIEIDTVHERTRVPVEILSKFERRGFPDRKRFNSVYRRSLVAAYARAIDINPDDVLRSAEETEIGRYRGRLAREYLGVETVEPVEPDFEARGDGLGVSEEHAQQGPVGLAAPKSDDKNDPTTDADSPTLEGSPRLLTVATAIIAAIIVLWLIISLI